jgi:hypothetical protein
MSFQEMIAEIPRLSLAQRIAVLEVVTKTLKEEMSPTPSTPAYRGVPAEQVRGLIKFDDGHIPDDAEVEELIAQAIIEKHVK